MSGRLPPPSVLNPPATRILPSACTAMEFTGPFAPGLSESGSGDCARAARARVWTESASAIQRAAWRIRLCVLMLLDWTVRSMWLKVEEWILTLQPPRRARRQKNWVDIIQVETRNRKKARKNGGESAASSI